MTCFNQEPYDCRVEWGLRGAREAAKRGDITIIVDVLSFSSTVVTALHHGAVVYPCAPPLSQAQAYADKMGGKLAISRAEAARVGGYSLSPLSYRSTDAGQRIVLCSLNGAACTVAAAASPALLIGCLLNAAAVAQAADRLRQRYPAASVTIVPCGEQWENSREGDNTLRPGIEDYIGAGAILTRLHGSRSPEAMLCAAAYESAVSTASLDRLLWECGSGRELRMHGYEEDVRHSSHLDKYDIVPLLVDGRFVNASK